MRGVKSWTASHSGVYIRTRTAPLSFNTLRIRWAKRSSFTALESTWVPAKWQHDNKMSERGREWLSRRYPELTLPHSAQEQKSPASHLSPGGFVVDQDNSDRNSTWCQKGFCWILSMNQTVLTAGYISNRSIVTWVFPQNQFKKLG